MGIIYKATNLQTGKCYIGQTTSPLSVRRYNHFRNARISNKQNYFYRALNKYDKEDWEWEVLEEVEDSKLDELERFYIEKFNSFGDGGYNSTIGGSWEGEGSPSYNRTVYEIYNGYRTEVGTLSELSQIVNSSYGSLQYLLAGRVKSSGDWIMLKDKDDYDNIQGYMTLLHDKYGKIRMKRTDFKSIWGLTDYELDRLSKGKRPARSEFKNIFTKS